LRPRRIIELGCFDAKTLSYLPCFPEYYLGLDANWEGGLDIGKALWEADSRVKLQTCYRPDDIDVRPDERFDVGIGMEVFEYLAEDLVEAYLARLADLIDGYLFVCMPVERGLPFAIRYLGKRVFGLKRFSVTPHQFFALLLGHTSQVTHEGHKGFDHQILIRTIARYFDVVRVTGVYPGFGPPSLNLQLAVTARSRPQTAMQSQTRAC